MSFIIEKRCLDCGSAFKGRKDKKFCSDQCRTVYHNRINSERDDISYMRTVNNALRKNRRILHQLNADGKSRTSLEILQSKGFNLQYHTSTQCLRDGSRLYYCYEHGYKMIGHNVVMLVKKKGW
jgi:predicted nucleic acid-binding Zn ribbon protein